MKIKRRAGALKKIKARTENRKRLDELRRKLEAENIMRRRLRDELLHRPVN